MDNLLKKIFKGVSIILIVIAAIYQIVVFYQGNSPSDSVLNGYFSIAYIAFGLAVVLALVFPVLQIVANPKGALKSLMAVAFLAVLWLVAYSLSNNTFTPLELEKMNTTAATSKLVGAGLIYTYFMFAMALGAIIYTGIANFFK